MTDKKINRWQDTITPRDKAPQPWTVKSGGSWDMLDVQPIPDEMLAELACDYHRLGTPWNCRSLPLSPNDREYMFLLYYSMQGLVARMRAAEKRTAQLEEAAILQAATRDAPQGGLTGELEYLNEHTGEWCALQIEDIKAVFNERKYILRDAPQGENALARLTAEQERLGLYEMPGNTLQAATRDDPSADVGHACATTMRATMVRLGVFPGEGLEWFQANIEDNIYLMCRAVNKLLDAIAASAPKGDGND